MHFFAPEPTGMLVREETGSSDSVVDRGGVYRAGSGSAAGDVDETLAERSLPTFSLLFAAGV
jgi:hypothetical protein